MSEPEAPRSWINFRVLFVCRDKQGSNIIATMEHNPFFPLLLVASEYAYWRPQQSAMKRMMQSAIDRLPAVDALSRTS